MKRNIVSMVLLLCVLIGCVGCYHTPSYHKTVSALVLLQEYDDDGLTTADIDAFMQNYYPDADYTSADVTNEETSFCHLIRMGTGYDTALCYGYETEETAKQEYNDTNNLLFQISAVCQMNSLYVRIGRFIFGGAAHTWKPFLESRGIECAEKEYTVAATDDVTKDYLEGWTYASIEDHLAKAGYVSMEYMSDWMFFKDAAGQETYLICNDPEAVAELKKEKKINQAFPLFENHIGTEASAGGLSYYCADDCVVFSRGNIIEKDLGIFQ